MSTPKRLTTHSTQPAPGRWREHLRPTSTASIAASKAAWMVARAAARIVSKSRPLHLHHLTEDECEALGVPFGSTEPHVYVTALVGARWWRLDAWVERSPGESPACLQMRLLGHSVEVWFIRRDQQGPREGLPMLG